MIKLMIIADYGTTIKYSTRLINDNTKRKIIKHASLPTVYNF